ncbi:hypothetical protein ACJQWK_05754 [Exserohilum turcicum]
MYSTASLIPRVLTTLFVFCLIYQLPWGESDYARAKLQLSNHANPTASSNTQKSPLGNSNVDAGPDPSLDYAKTHIHYGQAQCMPAFGNDWKQRVAAQRESCAKHAPFNMAETRRTAIASITTGKPQEAYLRAIRTQMFHSAVHKTSTHILCETLVDGAWNKIAFLLNLVLNELQKPKESRLEWIMWIDRDVIVLDPCRPLSSYLPPDTAEFHDINFIASHDTVGLNAGMFLFKVNQWSVNLFSAVLAFRYYRPDEAIDYAEQTAMDKILQTDAWFPGVAQVPWYWFNAYPDEKNSIEVYMDGSRPKDLEWFRARKGDFAVHFAGDDGRSQRMVWWLDAIENMDVWKNGDAKVDVTAEINEYWHAYRNKNLTDEQKAGVISNRIKPDEQ